MEHFDSTILIPITAFLVVMVAIVAGVLGAAYQRRLKSDQRLAMLQRGLPIADIERLLGARDEPDTPRDPLRRLTNTRTWALLLISLGVGGILFFTVLSVVVHEHDVLAGAAACLIPLTIGLGLLIDYRLQARDLARLSPSRTIPHQSPLT